MVSGDDELHGLGLGGHRLSVTGERGFRVDRDVLQPAFTSLSRLVTKTFPLTTVQERHI